MVNAVMGATNALLHLPFAQSLMRWHKKKILEESMKTVVPIVHAWLSCNLKSFDIKASSFQMH